MSIKGFRTQNGTERYDFGSLDNISVSIDQCNFIVYEKGANLFNKNTVTMDAYGSGNSVVTSSDAKNCALSDFIPVEGNTEYTRSGNDLSFMEFDSNQQFIKSTQAQTITTDANTRFVRVNMNYAKTPVATYMVVKGSTLPTEYQPYGTVLKIGGTPVMTEGSAGGSSSSAAIFNKLGTIGDSLNFQDKWQNTVVDILGLTATPEKNALTGSCVADYGNEDVTPFVSRYTNTSADCDCITIMGGTNDCTRQAGANMGELGVKNTNTFIGAYQTMIEGLLDRNPGVRIILITPPKCFTTENTLNANLIEYVNAIKAIAEYYSLPCLDLYHLLGQNDITRDYYTYDNVHFSEAGGKVVGRLIANFIHNNY